jgi:hypothetical protein
MTFDRDDLQLPAPVSAVLRSLAYADVFRWPLRADEIAVNGSYPFVSVDECRTVLSMLEQQHLVYEDQGYFSIRMDPLMTRARQDREDRAQRYTRIARWMGRLIALFPFTRVAAISGSLSKGSMPVDGDVDWFIITQPGRLWLTRTMLIAFKKVFLLNSRRYFCVNHFIDARHLAMRDQDLYTATEIATLIPIADDGTYDDFLRANTWLRQFYPAWRGPAHRPITRGRFLLKRFFEGALGGPLGDRLERWCKDRWQRYMRARYGATLSRGLMYSDGEARYQPNDVRDDVLRGFHARHYLVRWRAATEEHHG